MYSVTKILGGFPCAHRQHGHDGHCALVHGYSIRFELVFQAVNLDSDGFVVDFGKLKPLRAYCEEKFDHTLLINQEDPLLDKFMELELVGACKLVVVSNVSMENRAKMLFDYAAELGLPIVRVTCWENEKNAGEYFASS